MTSAPNQSEGEETDEHIDESADENIDESVDESADESVAATPVQGPGVSVQSGLTVCVFVGGPRDVESGTDSEQIQTSHSHLGTPARSDEDEPPQSVIHAPPGFGDFVGSHARMNYDPIPIQSLTYQGADKNAACRRR